MTFYDPVVRVACPFCNGSNCGRYHRLRLRFVCLNIHCRRCCEVVDLADFERELERQRNAFFDFVDLDRREQPPRDERGVDAVIAGLEAT